MPVTRLATLDDAEALAAQLTANREFLAPWNPARNDDYFTVELQRAIVREALEAYAQQRMVPLVVVDESGAVIGVANINSIIRGAFQSASVGYWISESHNGRGYASRALAETVRLAFTELGLHRLQAETLIHNTASQKVLTRNGFKPFAVAPAYLNIQGTWQDHILYYLINPD